MTKLIVLDRDGVINEDSPEYIKSPEEWRAIPGSLEAIANLCKHGYKVLIATNQSGIARKLFSPETLEAIHQKMNNEIKRAGGSITDIFICPHSPDDNCSCRKPKPGMLLQVAQKFDVSPSDLIFIGDSKKDILAAKECGARAILVKTGKGEETAAKSNIDVPVYDNLAQAVADIIAKS